ncbi:MAG: signal peptide peptidase SppA [Sphingobacteriia bacterium]|nr:signal peptide peptidase SppA [Sphingobacteriia bacterium]
MIKLVKKIQELFKKKSLVVSIPLKGVIGIKKNGITLDSYNDIIEKAFALPKIKAVILQINSPGGSPSQSELIYKKIRRLSVERKIKVITFVEDIAASGGYYIALAGEQIIAPHNSIIGSIGVISAGFGLHEAINKLGIQRRIYTSGNSKSFLDPFQPEKPEDVEILKELQNDVYENFVSLVKERRAARLESEDNIFSGRIWSGKKAKKLGLIDEISDLETYIEEKFGKKTKIIKLEPKKKGLLSKFGFGDFSLRNMLEEIWW